MGRETSALFYLTSTTMKAFIVLSLAATALAAPGRSGRRQGGNKGNKGAQKKDKMDPGNILRCAAENFGNNQTIKECLECFSAEMDFSSQGGLDAAKACASQFWPKGVAACGTEISAMAPGNMEALETVVECFDDRLEKENAERCLGEATSTELQGHHQLQQDSSLPSLRRLHRYHGGRNGHEGSSQMLQQGSAWQRGV